MIDAQHLNKTYQIGELSLEVIKDLSLKIEEGEFISIIGPSGSGKSTVLNMLGCLDKPTSGKIMIDDTEIDEMNRTQLAHFRGENIGFIFQSFNLIPVLSVYENIEYPLIMIQNLPEEERKKRILSVLKEVDMLDQKDKFPDQISGGQKQRVAIARALVTNPKIVFADEPTAHLDTETGKKIVKLMKELQKRFKSTFIVSTHDLELLNLADRIVKMRDGKVITDA